MTIAAGVGFADHSAGHWKFIGQPRMKTFSVQTLGCRVNHYESEQIAELLRSRGLFEAPASSADLRIINTCSVTMQAASQSRQSVRRAVRLPVLRAAATADPLDAAIAAAGDSASRRSRVLVTGCWATSNPADAAALPGVDAVVGHHQDLAAELDRLLGLWRHPPAACADEMPDDPANFNWASGKSSAEDARLETEITPPTGDLTQRIEPKPTLRVNRASAIGATRLPLLGRRQSGRQRAYLKIQDGCDAHCTYCIIPSLRPALWSKPIADVVEEAKALVGAGHVEIVLTGIFIGAYGQPTALRRRQPRPTAEPLGELVRALCHGVPGLRRLRISSLEPGDLTPQLLAVFAAHPQVVPHFHLPLQSGSDALLRRMNRQYGRDDYLNMIERVKNAYDRPALTTDVVVGFPGETDEEFERTLEVVKAAGFIHVHAFPYSPRPGTAAARWSDQFVRGSAANDRIEILRALSSEMSFAYRSSFVGQTLEVIVERNPETQLDPSARHGRCERYFPIDFAAPSAAPGDLLRVECTRVTPDKTFGLLIPGTP